MKTSNHFSQLTYGPFQGSNYFKGKCNEKIMSIIVN